MSIRSQRLFLYGTLLDDELRRAIVGPQSNDPTPATLRGFRRVRLAGTPYPTLRPDRTAVVAGLLLSGCTGRVLQRLTAFEGSAYRLTRCHVTTDAGTLSARVFRSAVSRTTNETWSFEAWAGMQRRRDIGSGRAAL